jgi:hypothetical protein
MIPINNTLPEDLKAVLKKIEEDNIASLKEDFKAVLKKIEEDNIIIPEDLKADLEKLIELPEGLNVVFKKIEEDKIASIKENLRAVLRKIEEDNIKIPEDLKADLDKLIELSQGLKVVLRKIKEGNIPIPEDLKAVFDNIELTKGLKAVLKEILEDNDSLHEDLKKVLTEIKENIGINIFTDEKNASEDGIPIVTWKNKKGFVSQYSDVRISTIRKWFLINHNRCLSENYFRNNFLSDFTESWFGKEDIISCFLFELFFIYKNEFEKFLFTNKKFDVLFNEEKLSQPIISDDVRKNNKGLFIDFKNENDKYRKWKYIHLFVKNEVIELTNKFVKENNELVLKFRSTFTKKFGQLATEKVVQYFVEVKRQYLYAIDFNLAHNNSGLENFLKETIINERIKLQPRLNRYYGETLLKNINLRSQYFLLLKANEILNGYKNLVESFTISKLENPQINFLSYFKQYFDKIDSVDQIEEKKSTFKIPKKVHLAYHEDQLLNKKIDEKLGSEKFEIFIKELTEVYHELKNLEGIDISEHDAKLAMELLKIKTLEVYIRYLGRESSDIPDILITKGDNEKTTIEILLMQITEIEKESTRNEKPQDPYYSMPERTSSLQNDVKNMNDKYQQTKQELLNNINESISKLLGQYDINVSEVYPENFNKIKSDFEEMHAELKPFDLVQFFLPFVRIDELTDALNNNHD